MPAGKSWDLRFSVFDQSKSTNFHGPFKFLDLAKRFKGLLRARFGKDQNLPYALIPDLDPCLPEA
jgi:hypothetical protein